PAAADATLLDVVRDTPDLSRVRELVDMSGFAPELDAARALTFLAPSSAAVQAWSSTPEGQAVLADPDAVYDLLLRHLVPAEMDEATIFTRTSLDTVSGDRLIVRQQSHTIDGADLLVADVNAANGYLHVVSDVLTGT
ncbi:MAG TPA: fasciclin domain-containing protein, partial [Ilumatobacter sp.]|nr:fasciclin domain-containing protein [Ilumatobacter sp.]